MPLSLYDVSITPIIHTLKTMATFLSKGQSHAADSETTLCEARIIADMGPLSFQIQRASDTAKGLAVRLGKAENVAWADDEKTFPELQERIAKTIAFLEKLDPKCMDGMEDAEVILPAAQGVKFTGTSYVLHFAIPNFYFHVTTAYAILRKEGIPVGKRDFLGQIGSA